MTTATTATDTWRGILDRLEFDLDAFEHVAAGEGVAPDTWTPPADAPPLPAELLPRAQDVLARQRRLGSELSVALRETAERRTAATPRSGVTHPPVRPAYLDVTA